MTGATGEGRPQRSPPSTSPQQGKEQGRSPEEPRPRPLVLLILVLKRQQRHGLAELPELVVPDVAHGRLHVAVPQQRRDVHYVGAGPQGPEGVGVPK